MPRSIDTAHVRSRARCDPDRVAALRQAWGIPSRVRIVLVPGRVAPWNGQITLVDGGAHAGRQNGMRGVTFVLVGDDRRHRRYARSIMKRAQAEGVDALFRIVGHRRRHAGGLRRGRHRRRAVHRAADLRPRRRRSAGDGAAGDRIGDRADARKTSWSPPRMPDDLRTGWVVRPGDLAELAQATGGRAGARCHRVSRAWRRARANSPSSCSRRTASPTRRSRSIRRCWKSQS